MAYACVHCALQNKINFTRPPSMPRVSVLLQTFKSLAGGCLLSPDHAISGINNRHWVVYWTTFADRYERELTIWFRAHSCHHHFYCISSATPFKAMQASSSLALATFSWDLLSFAIAGGNRAVRRSGYSVPIHGNWFQHRSQDMHSRR